MIFIIKKYYLLKFYLYKTTLVLHNYKQLYMKRTISAGSGSSKFAKVEQSSNTILTLPYDILKIILNYIWTPFSHLPLNLVCKRFTQVISTTNFFKDLPLPPFFPCLSVLLAYHPCNDNNVLAQTSRLIYLKTGYKNITIDNKPIKSYSLATHYCLGRLSSQNLGIITTTIANNPTLFANKSDLATYFLLRFPKLWELDDVHITSDEAANLLQLRAAICAICSDPNRQVRPCNTLASYFIDSMWHIPMARQYWISLAKTHGLSEACMAKVAELILAEPQWTLADLLALRLPWSKAIHDNIYQMILSSTDQAVYTSAEVINFINRYYHRYNDEDKHLTFVLKVGIKQVKTLNICKSFSYIRYVAKKWYNLFPKREKYNNYTKSLSFKNHLACLPQHKLWDSSNKDFMQYYTILVFATFDDVASIAMQLNNIIGQIELTNLWFTLPFYCIDDKTIEKILVFNSIYKNKIKLSLTIDLDATRVLELIKAASKAYSEQQSIIDSLDVKFFLQLIRNGKRVMKTNYRHYLDFAMALIKKLRPELRQEEINTLAVEAIGKYNSYFNLYFDF